LLCVRVPAMLQVDDTYHADMVGFVRERRRWAPDKRQRWLYRHDCPGCILVLKGWTEHGIGSWVSHRP
jgi:hypothetical protein